MIANGASIASTNNANVGVGATTGVSSVGGGQSGGRGPGKRTRKEPVDKSDATAFAASEMNKVNNTLHAFAGGKQKPLWMRNQNASPTPSGEPVRTTIRSQINPVRRRTTPLNRMPSQPTTARRNTTNIITIDDQSQGIPLLATVGPGKSPPSSLSPDLRGLPPTRIQRIPSSNMEAVLPSPAPSDSPSAMDRRDEEAEEGVVSVAAQDTPIGSPTDRVYDSEQDRTHGRAQDSQHVMAVGTRRETQTELSSSTDGQKDIQTMNNPENHGLSRASKRAFETTEDHAESAKRRKQASILPISEENAVLPSAQILRPGEQGEQGPGTNLNGRVQSPLVDTCSRQISPAYNLRSSQSPIVTSNRIPVIPSNASPLTASSHSRPAPTTSSQPSSAPLHYSTSLPPTTLSPLTQPPILGSLGIPLPSAVSDLNSWNGLASTPQLRAQGPASPQFRSQQQQQKHLQIQLRRQQQQQQLQQQQLQQQQFHQQQFHQQQLQQQQLQQQLQQQQLQQQHPAQASQIVQASQAAQTSQTVLRAFLPRINNFIQTEGGAGLRSFNAVECFRFKVLREAISKEDWFFTVMSQVYALTSNSEDQNTLFKETGISASLPGFQVLKELLEDNQRLCGRSLTYLAAFPVPIADAKQRLTFFPSFLEEVRSFLTDGYKIVGKMRDYYFKTGKVPIDEDLARDWNIRALVFRYIVVRYLQHQMKKLLLHAAPVGTLEHPTERGHRQALQGQHIQMHQLQRNHQIQEQQLMQRLQQVQAMQQQQQQPQNPTSAEGVPVQIHNYQSQLANLQHRHMSINHQPSPLSSPTPNHNIPQNSPPEEINSSNAVGIENRQPHLSTPQQPATQGQRLPNPGVVRNNGVSIPLSIDTQRAQQLTRGQAFQIGSVNNSPVPTYTPNWLSMPSSHMHSPIATPTANQAPNGIVNRVPPSPGIQQYSLSGLPSPAEAQARRNSRAQLQGPSQRRVASTPAQNVVTPTQQTVNTPIHRQSYVQGHPLEPSDMAVLNSTHIRQVNDASQITQPMQQTFHPPRPDFMAPAAMANALPSPRAIIPLPTPTRGFAQLPQNALQSHLMSPRFAEPPRVNGSVPARSKLYISMSGFAFPGVAINSKQPCQKVAFNITEDIEKKLSKTRPGNKPGDGMTRPMVSPGSLIYRLRSIKWTKSTQPLNPDQEWVSQETDWPVSAFIEVNGHYVELRRKPAWGKDLPADITSFIKTGDNEMKIAVLIPRTTDKSVTYAMAVEIHECRHEDDITNSLYTVPSTDAKALITKRLIGQSADGDDLMVVDSDQLSLAVTCPLSFTLMNSPVRGKSCTHLECFDFKNFLDSRPRRREWEPPNSDAWKCPICRGDARPGELVIDGFLVEVLNAIKGGDLGVQDPRNIVVKKDGSWEIKHEKENAVNEKSEDPANTNGATGSSSKKEVEVICLDDDDE